MKRSNGKLAHIRRLATAYDKGKVAAMMGKSITDCPYTTRLGFQQAMHHEWIRGFKEMGS